MALNSPSLLPIRLTVRSSRLVALQHGVQTPGPSSQVNEGGYVLILMLFVLISTGSAWMQNGLNFQRHGRAESIQTNSDWLAMGHARQALISYAAIYPYLYGPTGAGPGHLPCVANIITPESNLMSGSQPFGNGEGPNPPCARSNPVSGKLPRHISLPGHRYMFHAQSGQLFDYSVLRDVVNNPATHPVHPGRIVSKSDASRVIAWLSLNLRPQQSWLQLSGSRQLYSNKSQRPGWARMPITQQALLEAAIPGVAGWFISHAKRLNDDQAHCAGDIGRDGQSQSATADSKVNRTDSEVGVSDHESVLIWLFDKSTDTRICSDVELASINIEGVPAARHWFVRNQWHHWIEIVHDDSCTGNRVASCQLVFLRSDNDRSEADMFSSEWSNTGKIRLAWVPVS